MVYYVTIEKSTESEQVLAKVPDVQGALTVGKDKEDALHWIEDALRTILSSCMADGEPIPKPSRHPMPGEPSVRLSALLTAKLAVYEAMREQGLTQAELASRMGVDPRQVRRILDLYHNSRMDQIEAALKALGKRLKIEVMEAA